MSQISLFPSLLSCLFLALSSDISIFLFFFHSSILPSFFSLYCICRLHVRTDSHITIRTKKCKRIVFLSSYLLPFFLPSPHSPLYLSHILSLSFLPPIYLCLSNSPSISSSPFLTFTFPLLPLFLSSHPSLPSFPLLPLSSPPPPVLSSSLPLLLLS